MREFFRAALRVAGYSVVAVKDGIDALNRVKRQRPDAVVLDLGLPRLGGREVNRELKASPDTKGIPIIVVSGNDTADLNIDDFACILTKSNGVEALIAAVDDCMGRSGSTDTDA